MSDLSLGDYLESETWEDFPELDEIPLPTTIPNLMKVDLSFLNNIPEQEQESPKEKQASDHSYSKDSKTETQDKDRQSLQEVEEVIVTDTDSNKTVERKLPSYLNSLEDISDSSDLDTSDLNQPENTKDLPLKKRLTTREVWEAHLHAPTQARTRKNTFNTRQELRRVRRTIRRRDIRANRRPEHLLSLPHKEVGKPLPVCKIGLEEVPFPTSREERVEALLKYLCLPESNQLLKDIIASV